ncbi:MAG: SpoIID/LytB domain-containing protein [Vampirovibrionales bacterium]|nr:SpoIID/LytB domain-containing protein [Vampirovibrionales bacterium]
MDSLHVFYKQFSKGKIARLIQRLDEQHHLSVVLAYFIVVGLFSLTLQSFTLEGYGQANAQEKLPLWLQPAKLPTQLTQAQAGIVDADYIRVGLSDQSMQHQEYPSAKISATGPYELVDQATGKQIAALGTDAMTAKSVVSPVVTVTVSAKGFHLSVAGNNIAANLKGPILAKPLSPSSRISMPGVTRYKRIPYYRGYFEITRGYSSPAKLSVVNVLPIQDYLKAVVPNELPARYGTEAVRAQAIAARNYALRPRDKIWPQFDICDSQYCQAYYGAQTETATTTNALAETEGLVALYNGDIALALYSSATGGYSEAYSNAFSDPITKQFPAPSLPYLSGGPDLPLDTKLFPTARDLSSEAAARQFWSRSDIKSYDVNSPHYRWEKQFTRQQLEALLTSNLRDASKDRLTNDFIQPLMSPAGSIGTLKSMKITKRGVSGKAMTLEIKGSNGTWLVQKEFVIRKVLKQNNRMLSSGNFVINQYTDAKGNIVSVKLLGGGLGHGVGMSQLGASWMHFHGYSFVDIIRHYYKGVSLASIPLSVGGTDLPKSAAQSPLVKVYDASQALNGVQHSFFVKNPESAKLVLQAEASPVPVYLALNGKTYSVMISADAVASTVPGQKIVVLKIPVTSLLKDEALNTLALFPDVVTPARAIKAWVELYPAKASNTQVAKR